MRGKPKLVRRSDSPFWFIYIPPANGRGQTRFSTGEEDYSQAERVFAQWLLERKKPELSPLDEIRVSDVLTRYEEHKINDATVGYHMKHLKPFFKIVTLAQINNALIREYTKHRTSSYATRGRETAKRKVSPATVRRELDTFSAALGLARREGYIKEAPHIEKPPASAPKERWLTYAEAGRLLKAANDNKRLRLFIEIALNTGARPSSILDLKWFQVDLRSRLIHFNPEGRTQTKKHRPTVYINDSLLASLRGAKKKSEYVLGVKSLKKGFLFACKRAKLKGVTPYTLRHTAITWAIREGHSLALAGQLAGHKDPRTTMRYAKHDPSFTKEITATLDTGQLLAKIRPKNDEKRPEREKKIARKQ